MYKSIKVLAALFIVAFLYGLYVRSAFAQICYPQRIINQHRCISQSLTCWGFDNISGTGDEYRSEYVGTSCFGQGTTATNAYNSCVANCSGLYAGGYCSQPAYCTKYSTTSSTCQVEDFIAGCTKVTDVPSCQAIANIVSCFQVDANSCNETTTSLIYGCWGPGANPSPSGAPQASPTIPPIVCGDLRCDLGETCNSCPGDCGACSVQPTPTPTSGGSCGDGVCAGGENCFKCPADCSCATGTLKAKAVLVDPSQVTCANINNPAASPLNLTQLGFSTPTGVTPQTQISGQYVIWPGQTVGDYTLYASPAPVVPPYIARRFCWNSTDGSSGDGNATATLNANATVTYNVGLSTQPMWTQVVGGSLNGGKGNISVNVPAGKNLLDKESGVTQNSAVVSFGTTLNPGAGAVSADGYAVQDNQQTVPAGFSYYNYYNNLYGTAKTSVASPINNDPASGVYTISGTGNLTISGPWDVSSGQSVIVFVPGSLTINSNITVREGGFLAFIVSKDITVLNSMGQNQGSPLAAPDKVTQANVSGIYIADGQFVSLGGLSPDRQLVVSGTVVASSYTLNRDLQTDNATSPGELFIFRPDLWVNAPNELKEIDVAWQEVAP
jgi:hypothetical protein